MFLTNQRFFTIADAIYTRENNLDILRFLAATLVILAHAYPLSGVGIGNSHEIFTLISGTPITLGTIGVYVFFVISGFLIFQSYERSKDIFLYFKARFLRLFPALILVLLLSSFILGAILTTLPLSEYFSHSETYQYLKTVALFPIYFNLPDVFVDNAWPRAVNGSLWTIPYEFLCYVFLGFFGIFGLLKSQKFLVFSFCILVFLKFLGRDIPLFHHIFQWTQWKFIDLSVYFVMGMLLYSYREKIILHRYLAIASLFFILLSIALGGFRIVFLFFGSYLLMYLAFHRRLRFYNFAKHGDLSYGIYIYAFPTQQTLVHLYGGSMSPMTNTLISLPIVFICAYLSWHLVEKRALALKKTPLLPRFVYPFIARTNQQLLNLHTHSLAYQQKLPTLSWLQLFILLGVGLSLFYLVFKA